ncbi:MAG: hypothetical protein ACNI3H_07705 [Halarcobacter ebronensis]
MGSQSDFSKDSDDSLLGDEVVLLDMAVSESSKLFEDQKTKSKSIKKTNKKFKTSCFWK